MIPTKTSRDVGMVDGVSDATGSSMGKPTSGKSPGPRCIPCQCNNPVSIRCLQDTLWIHFRHLYIQPHFDAALLSFRSWARPMGEEKEEEELKEKMKCGKCLGRSLRAAACWCGSTVSAVWYVVRTFSSPVLIAMFKPCRTLVLHSCCITGYKQPPPSLHTQHYRAVWYYSQT